MSIESHLEALERRHAELAREIDDALKAHPSIDTVEIAGLKRRKLQLKDEIMRLKGPATVH